jgi:hypothetical protein
MTAPQTAFRFEVRVGPDGKLELNVPVAPGTPVEVLVIAPQTDDFSDLVAAASSSTGFWDNPLDAEDWNDA